MAFSFQKCSEDNNLCIPVFWYCDGKIDCPLGSDEVDCSCEKLNFEECLMPENTTICIPTSWACVGYPKCIHFDPEMCEVTSEKGFCQNNEFWCHLEDTLERQCISHANVCNNVTDCFGGEDEAVCSFNGKYCTEQPTSKFQKLYTMIFSFLMFTNTSVFLYYVSGHSSQTIKSA